MISCFFCQNLLSDFLEGILPASRHDELKRHIDKCPRCKAAEKDMSASLKLLKTVPQKPLASDFAMRVMEASQAGRSQRFTKAGVSKVVLATVVPALIFFWLAVNFPAMFPWLSFLKVQKEEAQFVRYYPLLQGATEILDEQGSWLHNREPLMGSVWEEGGLSPEEFEKTFQVKGGKGEEK